MADEEETASDVEAEPAAVSDSGTGLQFTVICAPGPARRIYATITGSILPLLHRLLTMKVPHTCIHFCFERGYLGQLVTSLTSFIQD
jgi:hypothetical protein